MATTSAVLFGTITFVSDLSLFLLSAYLVRFLEGVSMAVLWSTVLAILLATYPTRPAAVYSLLDTTFGLGLSLGPVLGSLLFSFSGFLLPFLACGVLFLSRDYFLSLKLYLSQEQLRKTSRPTFSPLAPSSPPPPCSLPSSPPSQWPSLR